MTDTIKEVLSRLADKPGAIATEIGSTPVEMIRMEKAGYVTRTGVRRIPGKRGRPPVEWMVTGAEPPEAKEDTTLESWADLGIGRDHTRILTYVDRQLDLIRSGKRQDENGSDEKMLRERRKQIIAGVKRGDSFFTT
jgi:hypothetical protein